MNINAPTDRMRLRAELEAQFRGVPHTVAVKIAELADGGLGLFEIQAQTGLPLPLIRLVLRGAPP